MECTLMMMPTAMLLVPALKDRTALGMVPYLHICDRQKMWLKFSIAAQALIGLKEKKVS